MVSISMLVNPMTAVKSSKLVIPTLMVGIIALSQRCLASGTNYNHGGEPLSDYDSEEYYTIKGSTLALPPATDTVIDIDDDPSSNILGESQNCSGYASKAEYSDTSATEPPSKAPSPRKQERGPCQEYTDYTQSEHSQSPARSKPHYSSGTESRARRAEAAHSPRKRKRRDSFDPSDPSERRRKRRQRNDRSWCWWICGGRCREQSPDNDSKEAKMEDAYYNLMRDIDENKVNTLYDKLEEKMMAVRSPSDIDDEDLSTMQKINNYGIKLKLLRCLKMTRREDREKQKDGMNGVLREAMEKQDAFAELKKAMKEGKANGTIDYSNHGDPFWTKFYDWCKGVLACDTFPQKAAGFMFFVGFAAQSGLLETIGVNKEAGQLIMTAAGLFKLVMSGKTPEIPIPGTGPAAKAGKRRLLTRLALSNMN